MTAPNALRDALAERLARLAWQVQQPHEWGYRDPAEGGFVADNTPFDLADAVLESSGPDSAAAQPAPSGAAYSALIDARARYTDVDTSNAFLAGWMFARGESSYVAAQPAPEGVSLPPLPEPDFCVRIVADEIGVYSAEQMQDYARAALATRQEKP